MKRDFRLLVVGLFLISPTFLMAKEDPPTKLKLSWEDIQHLLKLDNKEVRLSAGEFHALLQRTTLKKFPNYSESQGEVVLSPDEFKRLLDNLVPPPPSVSQTYLTKGVYKTVIKKESASITALLDMHLRNAQKKLLSVDVFPGDVAFGDVTLDGVPALVEQKDGRLLLSTNLDGHHELKIQFTVGRPPESKGQSMDFPTATTPITEVQVVLPTEVADFVFNGALHVQTEHANGGTKALAYLSPTNRVAFNWYPIIPSRAEGPAKLYADTNNLIYIEEDALRLQSSITLQVLQNTINAVDLVIPEGFTPIDVTGEQVGDWSVNGEKNLQVHVPFLVARKGAMSLSLSLEKILPADKITVNFPGVFVKGALRDKGFVGVELRTAAEVSVEGETKGLERVDTQELPADLVGKSVRPLLFGFRYLRPPFELPLTIHQHERVSLLSSLIDEAHAKTWMTEEGKIVSQFVYTIRNSGKQFLELTLPKKAQLWSVFVDGAPVKPSLKGEDIILLPLNRSNEGRGFDVEVVYFEEGSHLPLLGRRPFDGPMVDMMIGKMSWSFFLPPEKLYFLHGQDFEKGEEYVAAQTFSMNGSGSAGGFGIGGEKGSINEPVLANKLEENDKSIDGKDRTLKALKEGDEKSESESRLELQKKPMASMEQRLLPQSGRAVDLVSQSAIVHGNYRESGLLPVRINVPMAGEAFHFQRTLIMKGVPIAMNLFFASDRVRNIILIIFSALIAVLGLRYWPFVIQFFKPVFQKFSGIGSCLKPIRTPLGHVVVLIVINFLIQSWIFPIRFIGFIVFIVALVRWLRAGIRQEGGALS